MAWLVCTHGNDKGFETELVNDSYVMGRAPDCDVMILDERASRYHCRISRNKKNFLLEDLGSTNGIKVKSKRIKNKKVKLKVGDSFAIGKTVFVVVKTRDTVTEAAAEVADELGKQNRGSVVDKTYLEALSLEMQRDKKKFGWFGLFRGRRR